MTKESLEDKTQILEITATLVGPQHRIAIKDIQKVLRVHSDFYLVSATENVSEELYKTTLKSIERLFLLEEYEFAEIKINFINKTPGSYDEGDSNKDNHTGIYATEIPELEFSVRARKVLDAKGIKTIGEITQYSRAELSMIRGCGKHTLSEIKEKLSLYGLRLRD